VDSGKWLVNGIRRRQGYGGQGPFEDLRAGGARVPLRVGKGSAIDSTRRVLLSGGGQTHALLS